MRKVRTSLPAVVLWDVNTVTLYRLQQTKQKIPSKPVIPVKWSKTKICLTIPLFKRTIKLLLPAAAMFILMGFDSENRGVKWFSAAEKDELKHFLHSLQLRSTSGCPVSVWCSAKTKRESTIITSFLIPTVIWQWDSSRCFLWFFSAPIILYFVFNQELVKLSLGIKSYWQADVKSCGHPAQDGWIQVLGTVSCSHHHHLWWEASQWSGPRSLLSHKMSGMTVKRAVKGWCRVLVLTWVAAEVSSPSHRLMNWAFIMAVASWSWLERFLKKDSMVKDTGTGSKNRWKEHLRKPHEIKLITANPGCARSQG